MRIPFLPDPAALVVRAARVKRRQEAGLMRRRVQLANGLSVVYLDTETEKPPLLLVHGIGASKDHWPRLARRLADRLRPVAPDLPGFGDSDKPPPEEAEHHYSMAGQAETLIAFADELGLETFHLAGSSMGGRIAAELAARHPDRVRTLWLLDPAGAEGERPSEMIEGLLAGEGLPLFSQTADEYAESMAFTMSRPPDFPPFALRVLAAESARARDLNHRIFEQMTEEFVAGPTTEEILRGLPVPTLITWGEEDRVLHPSGAATIAAGMPDATVHLMPGIGHIPMLEDPGAAAVAYLEFLDAQDS